MHNVLVYYEIHNNILFINVMYSNSVHQLHGQVLPSKVPNIALQQSLESLALIYINLLPMHEATDFMTIKYNF